MQKSIIMVAYGSRWYNLHLQNDAEKSLDLNLQNYCIHPPIFSKTNIFCEEIGETGLIKKHWGQQDLSEF